jgi:Zn-dependent protease with chaperone function
VVLAVTGDVARVSGDDISRESPLATLTVSEAMGAAPRLVTFPDGAYCEIHDHAAFDALLAATGHDEGPVARWQRHPGWTAGSLIALLVVAWFGYRFGIPLAARAIADELPPDAVARLGRDAWEAIDGNVFEPSRLPEARRAALVHRFDAMPEAARTPHRIEFRSSTGVGANAFALPSGIIVVTDKLVELAGRDDEIVGVLAHELGHIERRHALRMVLESTIVGLAVTWYVGDVSGLAASVPAAILQARYSRDLEQEADDYAADMMKANGLPPAALADMLDALEYGGAARTGPERAPTIPDFLLSHPPTDARKKRLRNDRR